MTYTPETAMRAAEAMFRERRFAALVHSVVSQAVHKHGRIAPDDADRGAYDLATEVAAILLQTIYENDAELKAQKALADEYRKIAEDALDLSPMPLFILNRDDIK